MCYTQKIKKLILFSLLILSAQLSAQGVKMSEKDFHKNPIIKNIYTADPAPMVYGDTLYLYTTHDEDKLVNNFYTMLDWRCYSTKDMVNWTDHGKIFSLDDISWADDRAWAPQAIERDEGPIFSWYVDGQWDTMFAPDLVEVKDKVTGKKTYYLYPHSRGWQRVAMVCKGDRPDGPFTPINLTEDGRRCLPGSLIDFDPSVFIETITNKKDPDFDKGFRAYVFYGFQHSTACELDQNTMYSKREGTDLIDPFIPASSHDGKLLDKAGSEYKALYKGQNPLDFNFFEASSIRQVGNKYVMVFSGYSGKEYGLDNTNSALRYAFGDSPLGPWRSGGVLVDSRGVVPNEDGSQLMTTNAGHNTHGSLQEINGQWYVFYHRPPRGFGFARQPMVAPVKITWDKKKVADGGIVKITGYDKDAYSLEGKL